MPVEVSPSFTAPLTRPELVRTLYADVDVAEAMMGLAKISFRAETFRRNYESAQQWYARALMLMPEAEALINPDQELALRTRLEFVKSWLDSASPPPPEET
jgi:hypothetical protein